MNELENFLDFLFQLDEGYVYAPRAQRGFSWHERFFHWPEQRQELIDWVVTESIEHDVYVGPQLYSEKKVAKENIKSCNTVWLEYDGQDIDYKNIPEPDMVVSSGSPGHIHCYWKVTAQTPMEAIEETNRRLTYHLRADTSGWDATQVLRPPSAVNHKNGVSTTLDYINVPLINHVLEEFDSAPRVESKPLAFTPVELLDPNLLIKRLPTNLRSKVTEGQAQTGSRSTFLMNIGYQLARHGFSEIEAVSILVHVDNRIKKFFGRSDVLQRLGEIVAIAFLKVDQETNIQGYSPLEIVNHQDDLDWAIQGWLHTRGIMLVTGQPSVGKTQFSLHLAVSLSLEQAILTRRVKPGVKVCMLSLEMALEELNYIFRHQANGLDAIQKQKWNSSLKIFPSVDEGNFESYERIFEREKPDIVIIDSLSELITEDMKESEARNLMKWLKSMRVKHNHAQIIVHHNRKAQSDNKKPNKLSDLYGSFIFGKLSETVLCLWSDEKQGNPNLLELITVKARFDRKETYKLERNEHLLFRQVEEGEEKKDASGYSGSFGSIEDAAGFSINVDPGSN